jgi:hypothetical protein
MSYNPDKSPFCHGQFWLTLFPDSDPTSPPSEVERQMAAKNATASRTINILYSQVLLADLEANTTTQTSESLLGETK